MSAYWSVTRGKVSGNLVKIYIHAIVYMQASPSLEGKKSND